MDLGQIFQKQLEKIERIELFLDIYKCKDLVEDDLRGVRQDEREAADRVYRTKEYLEGADRKDQLFKYAEIMKKMRRNEQLMLHLMEVTGAQRSTKSTAVDPSDTPVVKQMPLKENNGPAGIPPSKMSLLDYSKSPFVSRTKSRKMKFYDFECEITEGQFETIPKYLRGRMQLAELQQFLETEIVKCFEEKYSLMYKTRKAIVNAQDLAIWSEYNLLQNNFPDQVFITQEDIARKNGKQLDKKSYIKLQMLRHLHILQEARHEGKVYFLWIYQRNAV
ncbi:spindle and kinetochore-associated protein 1-like [Anopheles aquasalis]|uniref:spindle and kinetochore-associated protein 1-like n=1 Tax=Anopheles aquasalis TaxID=42839 RepID=UPI00215AE0DB|nr:spindle and kinetochore-associated protein 1-like [Anopheles aquasalis]